MSCLSLVGPGVKCGERLLWFRKKYDFTHAPTMPRSQISLVTACDSPGSVLNPCVWEIPSKHQDEHCYVTVNY